MPADTLLWLGLATALFLPWIAAGGWLRGLRNPGVPGDRLAVAGYAYLVGMATTTLSLRLWSLIGRPWNFTEIALALVLLGALGWYLTRGKAVTKELAGPPPDWGSRAIAGIFLILILAHLSFDGHEISLRPLFPWDAWASWGYKAKIWFHQGGLTPIVSGTEWMNTTERLVYTEEARHYPPMVSLIQTWTALGLGRWSDTLINLPWLLCAIALGLGFYGQSRALGSTPATAMIFTYLALSMPILDTHVALAGYADLWLATAFSLSAFALLRWADSREPAQLLAAALLAAVCPLIKVEGIVWPLVLLGVWLAAAAPWLLAAALIIVPLGVGAVIATGGIALDLPGGWHFALDAHRLVLSPLAAVKLEFQPVWHALFKNLFALGNWHLTWYLIPMVLMLAILRRGINRTSLPSLTLIGLSSAIFGGIFMFSDAGRWAQDATAINRVLLHVTPALLFAIQRLWLHSTLVETPAKTARMQRAESG